MTSNSLKTSARLKQRSALLLPLFILSSFTLLLLRNSIANPVHAQASFDSGSTGADGAFAPATSQTVPLPASGVFNFTTVSIPSGVTIKFARNAANTPVTILASGNVSIAGTIDVSGQDGTGNGPSGSGGAGGPGGFDGGRGGYPSSTVSSGISGEGPGGGGGGGISGTCGATFGAGGGFSAAGGNGTNYTNCTPIAGGVGGSAYGANTLLPLIGGSGGGGGAYNGATGGAGGGGGGALLIASSGSIAFSSGSLLALGGKGQTSAFPSTPGGGGSGGAIRLIANTISGTGTLNVNSILGGNGGLGSPGYVRIEAYNYVTFSPTVLPSGQQPFSSFGFPSSVTLPNSPTLKITSVAGIAAPALPAGSYTKPADIVVPAAQANPVTVALAATNIPLDTVVQVTLAPDTGTPATVQSSALTGTVAASTATANLNLPATGTSIINATASYNVPLGNKPTAQLLFDGERIKRVEVSTSYGGRSEVSYITETGKRIKRQGD